MTNEVVEADVISAKDQTDWAMEYAEEARRRVKAERRLAAMAYALGGVIKAVDDAIQAIMLPVEEMNEKGAEHAIKELASLTMESFDGELMSNLNTFDAPWGVEPEVQEALVTPNDDRSPTQQRIMQEYFKKQRDFMEENYNEAIKEWDLICQQNDLKNKDDVRSERQREFSMMVLVKSMADKALSDKLKEFTDGQDKETKTH